MKWVYQHKDYGLGNFINITPIIKWLYEETGEPVPVYFESDYVKKAYEGHKKIEILDQKPDTDPIVSSRMHCLANDQEDYIYNFEEITGLHYTNEYKPFIIHTGQYDIQTAVILRGSGSEDGDYLNSKMPPLEVYVDMIRELKARGIPTTFIGSWSDYQRSFVMAQLCDFQIIGKVWDALYRIERSFMVIGNDTGMVHAAGCYDVPTFVMWKDTLFPRCKNSGERCRYSHKDWMSDFKTWIDEL